jgi:hypothetical protein
LNNKPVGVVCEFEGILVGTLFEQLPDGTPLYTHPAKTLTEDTECQYCKQGCIRCDARKLLTDKEILRIADSIVINDRTLGNFSIDFARAILRKAQEK